jgi:hypothetical protein
VEEVTGTLLKGAFFKARAAIGVVEFERPLIGDIFIEKEHKARAVYQE